MPASTIPDINVAPLPNPASTAEIIASKLGAAPKIALGLGSGLGSLRHRLGSGARRMLTSELPGFPPVKAPGHSGELILGEVAGAEVLLLAGRAHYYEGNSMASITFPIRVIAALGVKTILLTNAAGAINENYKPGEFMALSDHINFMGANPLAGASHSGKSPFLDLTGLYDPALRSYLVASARSGGIHEGVYLAVSGPCYETPAEIRAFRSMGADAVGMSTVPEAIVARHCGLRVAALSCLTNMAAGVSSEPLSHDDVLARGAAASEEAFEIIGRFLAKVAAE